MPPPTRRGAPAGRAGARPRAGWSASWLSVDYRVVWTSLRGCRPLAVRHLGRQALTERAKCAFGLVDGRQQVRNRHWILQQMVAETARLRLRRLLDRLLQGAA